jgi:hypothetical protein
MPTLSDAELAILRGAEPATAQPPAGFELLTQYPQVFIGEFIVAALPGALLAYGVVWLIMRPTRRWGQVLLFAPFCLDAKYMT